MCQEIFYKLLNCKKLDWLKKEYPFSYDKYDLYFFIAFVIFPFGIYELSHRELGTLSLFIFSTGSHLGIVRHIKSVPGDIESILMSPCITFIIMVFISFFSFMGTVALFFHYIFSID